MRGLFVGPAALLAGVIAQAAGASGGDAVSYPLTALGAGGATAAILWKIHQDHVKRATEREDKLRADLNEARTENRQLTNRLFLLADRGTEVGQVAAEVASKDDTELLRQMQRVEALLEQRGGR